MIEIPGWFESFLLNKGWKLSSKLINSKLIKEFWKNTERKYRETLKGIFEEPLPLEDKELKVPLRDVFVNLEYSVITSYNQFSSSEEEKTKS